MQSSINNTLLIKNKKFDLSDPVQRKQYNIQYRAKNRDKLLHYRKQNRNKTLQYERQRWQQFTENKKTAYKKAQQYYHKLYDKYYYKQRELVDPLYKSKNALRRLVYSAFKRIGKNKPACTEQLLGCSWIEAKAHFERLFQEGMTWKNHGEWHIDHIRPVASFKLDELHLMNHISNLQPLWAVNNLSVKKVNDNIKWQL